MSFSSADIQGMLEQYEADYRTGMDTEKIAGLIYEYTSGYPYLVSCICKLMDEQIAGTAAFPDRASAWTEAWFYEAVERLTREKNPLYESLFEKLRQFPDLEALVREQLFNGFVRYHLTIDYIKEGVMCGLLNNDNGTVVANRIFEAVLYDYFLSREIPYNKMFAAGSKARNQLIADSRLNVKGILIKFIEAFNELYGKTDDSFIEDVASVGSILCSS